MTAVVVVHPRAREQHLYAVASMLKTRGWEIPSSQAGQRFLIAVPDAPPPWRPEPTPPEPRNFLNIFTRKS